MLKLKVQNQDGSTGKEVSLDPAIFDIKPNKTLLQQVVVAMLANQRQTLAHTKTRGEVRGGGRKPWKQKGTGRARHGSRRSPIWVGGGVTFGPSKDQNYSQKLNKKMRRKALFMALTNRAQEQQMFIVDHLPIGEFSTKGILKLLESLNLKKSVLFVGDQATKQLVKSTANVPLVDVIAARNLNVLAVLQYRHVVFSESAIAQLKETFIDKTVSAEPAPEKKVAKQAVTAK